jgi:predicted nucleotidyltransferase component of viral defense system
MGLADNPILTEEQKRLLQHFSRSDRRQSFYLTGGTALSAFYLLHRVSEDLDFFSGEKAGVEEILTFLKTLPDIVDMQYERKFDRKIFLLRHANGRMVRVEFTYYPFPRSEEGLLIEGVHIDSLKDILVNKLVALTDRRDPKDYVDLYVALKSRPDLDIAQLVQATEVKFGVKGVKHIVRGRFLEPLPPMGTLMMRQTLDLEDLVRFFRGEASAWISSDNTIQ